MAAKKPFAIIASFVWTLDCGYALGECRAGEGLLCAAVAALCLLMALDRED